jgi:RHS repeat-associated protein
VYFYGPNGKLLTVVQVSFNATAPYVTMATLSNRIYFGKMLLGTTNGQVNTDSSLIKDRLGSVQPSYAYGTATGSGEQTSPGDDFATYWKDSSTGFEYAMNRYYSTGYGRFLTVDPFGGSARVSNPGSMNRYTYALGDPLNLHDPTGLSPEVVGSGCDPDDEGGWVCYTIYSDDGTGGPGEGRGGVGSGGGGFTSKYPKCNQANDPVLEQSLNFLTSHFGAAMAEAVGIAVEAYAETGGRLAVSAAALATAFVDWSAWETSAGTNLPLLVENNDFGQQGNGAGNWNGSSIVPSSIFPK